MENNNNNQIGMRLQYWRMRAGLSREAMASKINCTYPTISAWEDGESSPSIEKVSRFCTACGIPIDHIVGKNAYGDGCLKRLISTREQMKQSKKKCVEYGTMLYTARMKSHMPMWKFADIAHRSMSWWCEVESGKRVPPLIAMVQIDARLNERKGIEYDEKRDWHH